MLPPWLAESDGGGAGYEEPVQNLPQEDLIDDSPRRRDKKKRKGLFGRDKEAPAAEPTPEPRSDSWSQPQARTDERPTTWSGADDSWDQPEPSRDSRGRSQQQRPAPQDPADARPSGPQSREPAPPGLPTRQPGEHRGAFQPLGQQGAAPEPMPSNEATTRYTRPEPEAARLPEPPTRLPEPPARLPEPPVAGDRPYLPGPPPGATGAQSAVIGGQPSTPEPRGPRPELPESPAFDSRAELPGPPPAFDGRPAAARPDLPGPPPSTREFDSAPPASSTRPPLPDPPSGVTEQAPPVDGPPPWLAGPSDPAHLGSNPEAPVAPPVAEAPRSGQPPWSGGETGGGATASSEPAQPVSGAIPPRGRHWLPSDDEAAAPQPEQSWNAPPFSPPTGGESAPEQPRNPAQPAVGDQRGPDGRRIPGAFAPPATGSRAPVSDQLAPGERRDPGVFNQPSEPFTGQPGTFAPAASDPRTPIGDPPAPAERRDPGLYNQPSEQPSAPGTFAAAGADTRAPIGDQPRPGERRDPGLYSQPNEQAGAPGTFAPNDHRAPIGDQPAPGERRDPGVFNQPFNGQSSAPGTFAPNDHRAPIGDQPAPGERRDPGVFNQPNQPFNGQSSAPGTFANEQRAPVGDQPAPVERRDPGVFNQQSQPFNGQPNPYAPPASGQGGPAQGTAQRPPSWDQQAAQQYQQGYQQPQGGQWNNNGPRPSGPPPSLDDVPLRRAKKAPGGGWRKAVHHMSGGTINPGMSAEELRLQELVARIRQPVRGDYRIAVLSLKGGVGKTTTTMGLGSIYASIRGDRVIAVDANPDFGTLSQRVPLQTRSTVRDLLLDPNVERYSDVRKHTSQATSRLEVLASERDPAASEQFTEHEYRAVARILQRYYNIILTDCGTGLTHSAMSGVLDLAHSLVLISSAAIDGARSAASTLDWLSLHGHDHLVRNAVVVINLPREGSVNVGIQQLREYFLARCRAVHIIPFDDHLSEGAEIDLHRLSKQAKRAYVELAATVADQFNIEHRRYHD
ncbi:AAA family ATPase [Nocardia sp. NPDC050712]|uniref:MinD/ParA family ATP-binding protein n=1 Tax=Nocardia sp. NPDC050712 TaxID=3155518 RepID=UPI0033D3210C